MHHVLSTCITFPQCASHSLNMRHVPSTCITFPQCASHSLNMHHVPSTCITFSRRASRSLNVHHVPSTCVTFPQRASHSLNVHHVPSTCVTFPQRASRSLDMHHVPRRASRSPNMHHVMYVPYVTFLRRASRSESGARRTRVFVIRTEGRLNYDTRVSPGICCRFATAGEIERAPVLGEVTATMTGATDPAGQSGGATELPKEGTARRDLYNCGISTLDHTACASAHARQGHSALKRVSHVSIVVFILKCCEALTPTVHWHMVRNVVKAVRDALARAVWPSGPCLTLFASSVALLTLNLMYKGYFAIMRKKQQHTLGAVGEELSCHFRVQNFTPVSCRASKLWQISEWPVPTDITFELK